ncbi:uncharacterized exonuclease domain-containing protein At3g15140 isoform X2 [Daucus carota subsp. sativus]|uniref:uncharacterized exonuclease domain-containing protein At3g15140 isoform X2 n=1 Tax=Daucus carota subsp. sativus TaxID=79200 RepID=UPI0007EF076F|nr:PREDICTED: uncharacterized exonuclease domain-containing protein At3g15140-like isoform X2 [Daucus carota subsp. sativus]
MSRSTSGKRCKIAEKDDLENRVVEQSSPQQLQTSDPVPACLKLVQNCYNCGQEGHYASRCAKPRGTCYECGEAGHKARDCKQPRKKSHVPRVPALSAQGVSGSFSAGGSSFKMDFKTLAQSTISRPLCLYFTLGCCTKMEDQSHLKMFNHSFPELDTKRFDLKHAKTQQFDFFLVLDLEGKVEILEFPVLMIDAKTLKLVDFFHRFVRPTGMSKEYTNQYVDGKYGKLGVNGIWHETAIPFKEVIQQFEDWLATHRRWAKESKGYLNKGAFITCGNWDIKTKIPEQYVVAGMKLPPYFMEWINLKDIYLNFYNREATGMVPMLSQLKMQVLGTHHVGIDDTRNIARVLQRLIVDGAVLQLTGWKTMNGKVEYLFNNRIKLKHQKDN